MTHDLPATPFPLFQKWLNEAESSEPAYPNAMSVATADRHGRPSVRTLLLKDLDDKGFIFYTNKESNKGRDLKDNPQAALCFYWKSLGKQVRAEGRIENISEEEADSYFNSRPRGSRIGAWASQQSRPLDDYETLKKSAADFENKFDGQDTIPRPAYWGGYRLVPDLIEFWIEGEFRLHKRYIYTPGSSGNWEIHMIYP